MDLNKKIFGKDFVWGAATAAYQIEGHPEERDARLSDWSHWVEQEYPYSKVNNTQRQAYNAPNVLEPTGSGKAIQHWDKLEEDLDLIAELGIGAYRFSFNWATLHRGPGDFDLKTLDFYRRLISGLKDRGVKAFPTLVHFTLPQWLVAQGSWENPKMAIEFENYTKFLLKHFSEDIDTWLTHNEPNIFIGFGYEAGIWPPGYENNWDAYARVYRGLLEAHKLAYQAIKAANPNAQVGFAQNLYSYQTPLEAGLETGNPIDLAVELTRIKKKALDTCKEDGKEWINKLWSRIESNPDCERLKDDPNAVPKLIRQEMHNYLFVEDCAESETLDLLGINYYTRFIYKHNTEARDFANLLIPSMYEGELIPAQSLSKMPFDKSIALHFGTINNGYLKTQNNTLKIGSKTNSLGWEVYPKGLYQVLTDSKLQSLLKGKPLFITENGYSYIENQNKDEAETTNPKHLAASCVQNGDLNLEIPQGRLDLEDNYRIEFFEAHLKACAQAIQEGVNLQGFFYWSLLDNFEWALGMDPRFGLIHVDHQSFKRTPKASYKWYRDFLAQQ